MHRLQAIVNTASLLVLAKTGGTMALRHRIREVAESKGFTRTRLSRRADINYRTVDALWSDPYHVMTTETLYKIARALNVPVADLMIEEPDKEARE